MTRTEMRRVRAWLRATETLCDVCRLRAAIWLFDRTFLCTRCLRVLRRVVDQEAERA
jgi:hypothetical protein